jgi:HAD superfamily hydrolase (TIGR01484 family)
VRSCPQLRALVTDFDGTLSEGGRPEQPVLDALARVRHDGSRVVLATGRILDELLEVFPDVLAHVDALVCENGATVTTPDGSLRLADPVEPELQSLLVRSGVQVRRGEVLLATKADAAETVLDAVRELGLDTQLVFNRGELMLLPAGVTKATGAQAALRLFALSPHNAVAIGDAENDHHLLRTCELAACPANAVTSLKEHADLVLPGSAGEGVVQLVERLESPDPIARSDRWSLSLGTPPGGEPVTVPAAGENLLVVGPSGSGKSYLAGVVAEQLIEQGFDVLVVDPEGDHQELRRLAGVRWFASADVPERADDLAALLGGTGSTIVDLSHMVLDDRVGWLAGLPGLVRRQRQRNGSPHWIVLDEAHLVANDPVRVDQLDAGGFRQVVLSTYLPDLLAPRVLDVATTTILLGEPDLTGRFVADLASTTTTSGAEIARQLVTLGPGDALVVRRDRPPTITRLPSRITGHVRHWHKYAQEACAEPFHFRASNDELTGATASNLSELHDYLLTCDPRVVQHHARRGDLSRWVRECFSDPELAGRIADAEGATTSAGTDASRDQIVAAISERYLRG